MIAITLPYDRSGWRVFFAVSLGLCFASTLAMALTLVCAQDGSGLILGANQFGFRLNRDGLLRRGHECLLPGTQGAKTIDHRQSPPS